MKRFLVLLLAGVCLFLSAALLLTPEAAEAEKSRGERERILEEHRKRTEGDAHMRIQRLRKERSPAMGFASVSLAEPVLLQASAQASELEIALDQVDAILINELESVLATQEISESLNPQLEYTVINPDDELVVVEATLTLR